MGFRKIQDNSNWNNYNIIVNHNINNLENLKIPFFLKKSFSKLLTFYPLPSNKEETFFKLSIDKKVPFLFKYLIKKLKENNFNKSQIEHLLKLKEKYDYLKNKKYSESEKKDRIEKYLISKNYESILNLHLANKKIKDKFYELSVFTKMMINSLIDKEINKVKESLKDKGINYNNNFKINYHNSFSDEILLNISKSSKNVSEWNLFIEEEVQKRLEKRLEKSSKKSNMKSDLYESSKSRYIFDTLVNE